MDDLKNCIEKRAISIQDYLISIGVSLNIDMISNELSNIIKENLDQTTNSFLKTVFKPDPFESHS